MRHPVILLLPLLALAGCGRPSLDKADGSFDRAGYQEIGTRECADGMRRTNPAIPEQYATRLCGCIMVRLIAGSTDDELRAFHRDDQIPVTRMQTATAQCGGPTGPDTPLPTADTPVNFPPQPGEAPPLPNADDVPPPPEEPPPSMTDGTPPTLVAPSPGTPATPAVEEADGPDAGTGASAPGGSRARVGRLANYITGDDYPAAALRNNQQGQVAFILDIDSTGRVSACRVTASSGSTTLDQTTCRIMRSRPRYTPARNPRGVAVADRDRAIVRWQLPSG